MGELLKLNYHGVHPDIAEPYIHTLSKHIGYVQEAGEMLGVDPVQLKMHDMSKWSAEEFPAYANRFYGEPDEVAFKYAWLHHLQNNPHHWNHWLLQNDEDGMEALEMPQHYALEMVADWMGASRAYTGTYDMTDWLRENFGRMILHPKTRQLITNILVSRGYSHGVLNGHE